MTNNILERLIRQGGANSQMFWKLRKQIIKKDEHNYDTIDEEGNIIEDANQAKDHIANYFESLYQAREGTPEYEQWTRKIKHEVNNIEKELRNKEPVKEITINEVKKAIKSLKRGQSTGPDNLPNEIFLEAENRYSKNT